MKGLFKLISFVILLFFYSSTPNAQTNLKQQEERPTKFDALQWRFIGPIVGNRGSVVVGHPTEPNTFFHGASNGLWKTEDAGTYWEPVGDDDFNYGSIGAMEFLNRTQKLHILALESRKCATTLVGAMVFINRPTEEIIGLILVSKK